MIIRNAGKKKIFSSLENTIEKKNFLFDKERENFFFLFSFFFFFFLKKILNFNTTHVYKIPFFVDRIISNNPTLFVINYTLTITTITTIRNFFFFKEKK